jgi:GNAT superfamily N-acetyltransferase
MIVREAAPGERDELRALLTAAYAQYAAAVPVAALFDRYLTDVTDVDREAGRTVTLVAVGDASIAGTARLYPPGAAGFLPAGWAWVRAVGVHPELRRAGVARQLMAECRRRAAGGGATVLSLHTMAFMPGAVRLYERLGYRREPAMDVDLAEYYGIDGEMAALGYRLDLDS